jgi:uncharacterized membrane protein HdeD (DUF308 family)
MGVEFINRTTPGGWLHALPRSALLIVVAQWCLYRCWNGAPHWMIAWVLFALVNSIMRVALVYFVSGENVNNWWHVLAGVATMLLGSFLIKEGLS